jgi:hypothetical protein
MHMSSTADSAMNGETEGRHIGIKLKFRASSQNLVAFKELECANGAERKGSIASIAFLAGHRTVLGHYVRDVA